MNYSGWITAGILVAIVVILICWIFRNLKDEDRLTNFVVAAMLDEDFYRQQQERFLRLMRATNAESPFILFITTIFTLHDWAQEEDLKGGEISRRMWLAKLNTVSEIGVATNLTVNSGSANTERYLAMARFGDRIRPGIFRFRRRMRALFGLGKR